MIDMFPHLIWDEEMEITTDDYSIALTWLSCQIKIIKPSHVFIANKTQGKKILAQLKEKTVSVAPTVQVVSHPGYSNRKPEQVKREWSPVVDLLLK